MPYTRPTLAQLQQRITTDLATRAVGIPTVLRRSIIGILGTVIAGAVHLLYGYIAWLALQVFPDTATSTNLVRWASIWGIFPKVATYNTGNAIVTGVPGSVLPALDLSGNPTVFSRADGTLYSLTADVNFTGSGATVTASAALIAQVPGSAPACDPGVVLTIQSPTTGVSPTATVDSNGITGGFDPETPASLLSRLLFRIANPSRGGNAADYVVWATSQPGVTRAWCYPLWLGPGTVGIAFVYDGQTSIIPTTGQIAAMQSYINAQAPAHVQAATAFAPTAAPLNPTIHINPSNAAIQAAIVAELQNLITTEGAPSGTLLLSHIDDAIGEAVGTGDYTLDSPTANQTYTDYEIPTLGTITWV